jgi:hypothetical protein
MKPCKAKLPDGKPCPNQVDERQQYCPFHLSDQDAKAKNIISMALGAVLGVVALAIKGMSNSKNE